VVTQYPDEDFELGENYIIPKPFDPRLLWTIAPAVAQAAMDDGVATRPIADRAAYRDRLRAGMLPSYQWMKPLLQRAKSDLKRIVFAEGEDERVLCAAIAVAEQKLGMPCVIGRRAVIQDRLARLASGIKEQALVEIIDLDDEPVHGMLAQIFLDRMQRNGVTAEQARHEVRINNTLAAALLCLREGYDAAVCGGIGSYASHLETLNRLHADAGTRASMNAVFQEGRAVFICDAGLNPAPSLEERAAVAVTAAEAARRFNIEPHLGLLAPAAAGTKDSDDAYEELAALKDMIEQHASSLRISPAVSFCDFTAAGGRNAPTAYRVEDMKPNVLIMPDAGMGNVLSNLLRTISDDAVTIGPVLLGDRSCVQVAGPSSNALDFVELAVLAAVL
jgi:malate dehydrogenase (oxaloacetate-decarboxylating)(NADP+)